MSNNAQLTYETIDNPYDSNLNRSESDNLIGGNAEPIFNSEQPSQSSVASVSGENMGDMWISNFIKSKNYQPKVKGFLIDGITGKIECMSLYATGSIIGSAIHIPNDVDANSFHVNNIGSSWWGCNEADFISNPNNAPAYILNTGVAKFSNITINGGTVQWSTISGTTNAPADNATEGATWNANIIGQPTDASILNPSYITSTKITSTTIESPIIAANNGYISGILKVGNSGIVIDGANKYIYSSNYSIGISGWKINNTGSAEFNDVTVRGTIYATSGNISGNLVATGINATNITTGSLSGITLSIGTGNNIFKADANGIYLGYATFPTAPFRVNLSGEVTATKITISTPNSSYAGSPIANAYIGNLVASKITSGDIDSARMSTNVLTALQVNVTSLSAIRANLGTITAGTISGITFNVSSDININNGATNVLKLNANAFIARVSKSFAAETATGVYCQFYGSSGVTNDGIIEIPDATGNLKIMNETSTNSLLTINNTKITAYKPFKLLVTATPPSGAEDGWMFFHDTWDEIWVYKTGAWKALAYVA
jgi:hypothetical protein